MNNTNISCLFVLTSVFFRVIFTVMRKALITIYIIFFLSFGLVSLAQAEEASLSIYPQTGTFTVGSTFDVSIFVNTGGNNVNAVRVDLKFNPKKLQVITPAKGLSAVAGWTFPPSFSNTKGDISLQGRFFPRGINTSEGLISVIVFEVMSSGRTEVHFLDSSQVLVGEEEGINILTSVNRGVYDIVPSPPMGPRIFSESHPDQNKWYKNNSPVFSWERIEKAVGYSFLLDDDPFGEPDNTIDTESTSISFSEVEDGGRYFHLRVKKEQIWGGTSHFRVMIDNIPPSTFEPYLEPFRLTSGSYLLIYFNASDLLSGINHYEARLADFTDPENVVLSAWIREESPFRLSTERSGTFEIFVRAFDEAGNFREGKVRARVLSPPLIIVSGGIQIKGFFVPWWLIYGVVGLIIIFVGRQIYFFLRRKNLARRLRREVAEAEKEIEDVKKVERTIRETRILEEEARKESERLAERLKGRGESPQNSQKTKQGKESSL